jgi:tape measure domain-containing protein
MPTSLLDIAIVVTGANQATSSLIGFAASATQAYSANEMLVQSLDSLVAKQISLANNMSLNDARKKSVALTKELVEWTQKLGIVSPFSQGDIAKSFQMSMAFGFSIKQAKAATEAVVDFASANARSSYDMQGIILALGQAYSRGKLQGEEANQLLERGVPVWQYVARAMGKTTSEVQNMSARGLIPAKTALEAITKGINEDFGGAAANASNTIQGLTSSFQDLVLIAQRKIVAPTIETIRPFVVDLNEALSSKDVSRWLDNIGITISDKMSYIANRLAPIFKDTLKTSIDIGTWIAEMMKGITDKVMAFPGVVEFFFPFAREDMAKAGYDAGAALIIGISSAAFPALMRLMGNMSRFVLTTIGDQLTGAINNKIRDMLNLSRNNVIATFQILGRAPGFIQNIGTQFGAQFNNVRSVVQSFTAGVFGSGSRADVAVRGFFSAIGIQAAQAQAAIKSLGMEMLRMAAWQMANQAAMIALPFLIGTATAQWLKYKDAVKAASTAMLESRKWFTDTNDKIEESDDVLHQAKMSLRDYNQTIRDNESATEELKRKQDKAGKGTEEYSRVTKELTKAQNENTEAKVKAAQLEAMLAEGDAHKKKAKEAQDDIDTLTQNRGKALFLTGTREGPDFLAERAAAQIAAIEKKEGKPLSITRKLKIAWQGLWVDQNEAQKDVLAGDEKKYNDAIAAKRKIAEDEAKKAQETSDKIRKWQKKESDVKSDAPEQEEALQTTTRKKLQDLAEQQAEKLIGLREDTNRKMEELTVSFNAAQVENDFQRNKRIAENDYRFMKAKEENEYQFQRRQAESQRTWNYQQSENLRKRNYDLAEKDREWNNQQLEEARNHSISLAEEHRSRMMELGKIADDLKPAIQTSLDTVASAEADFETGARSRLEEFNKKRLLLARQGAICKLPEEQKAFAEQEAQAAEAYQKQEQQQRAALGRQLIDFTVAMALKNNVSAQAMNEMVTGIAKSTGAYDSVTAGLLGNTFAGITNWAQSGGKDMAGVLSNVRALPEAAKNAKMQEEALTKTLRLQAVSQFQRTGDVKSYQKALNEIPQQMETKLGLKTDNALAGGDVFKGQQQWKQQQAESERSYQRDQAENLRSFQKQQVEDNRAYQHQQDEDNRAHQHQQEEDLRSHQIDIQEMERQHKIAEAEEERQYKLDKEEAERKHLKELENMRGDAYKKQMETIQREGDKQMAEELAKAAGLSAIQRAALTGDYQAAVDFELKTQNWLTQKLNAVDYSDPDAAQKGRTELYQGYGSIMSKYSRETFGMSDQFRSEAQRRGESVAPASYQGAPLDITVNLQADGMVQHTVKKTVEVIHGQVRESQNAGRHAGRRIQAN